MQRPYTRRYLQPNNMREAFFGDFEYVVTQKAPPRVCFGSGIVRDVLPRKGPALSPFMRRLLPECVDLGPGSYDNDRDAFYDLRNRITSKYGLGARSPRFKHKRTHQPPPRIADVIPIKKNCAPFNSTSKRKPLFKAKDYPAPCEYYPDYKKKELKFDYSFQGKKNLRCAVAIKCVPYNLDCCGVCDCLCTQQGDYWHFENRIFLCRQDYEKIFTHCLAKFQGVKLSEFKSIRDCFFAHAHNSCKAALKIMKKEEIEKKLRKEAYLDLFFPQRRFCST